MKIKKIKNIIMFIFEIRRLMVNYFYYFKKKFIFDSIFLVWGLYINIVKQIIYINYIFHLQRIKLITLFIIGYFSLI